MRTIMIAAVGATCLLAGPALAREGAWMSVGNRPIDATTATQSIEVTGVNVAREAMFCSDDSAVVVVGAEFRFRNGDAQTLQFRERIRAGDCSRVFRLRNRDQELASVTVTADPASVPAGSTAQVRVLVH